MPEEHYTQQDRPAGPERRGLEARIRPPHPTREDRTRRLGEGRLFAYVSRQINRGIWLGDDDVVAMAVGAGGLMVSEDHAGIVRRLRDRGYQVPVLLDPACYFLPAGQGEQLSLLDADSLQRCVAVQGEHQVALYLSPSRYVPVGDTSGLKQVLESGRRFVDLTVASPRRIPAMVALPIDFRWFGHSMLDRLIEAVAETGTPVAVMPGGQMDPLASATTIRGLVVFLEAVPQKVAVLRTDLAGLGALAYGATATAFGVSTALRHVVPPGKRPFNQPDPTPRVLIEPLLSWARGSVLEQVERDEGMLECSCVVCHGQSLRRFGNPRSDLIREAAIHSVLVWRSIADRLLTAPSNRRPGAWTQLCDDALELHARLRVRAQIELKVPDYLSSWTALR